MPRQIRDEAAPAVGRVRIGIELEGVGTVSTKWTDEAILALPNFHDVFKRTKLVRSNSFNAGRGVYITPEDSNDFGKTGPAELVSSPHQFDVTNLNHLRNSVKKALKPMVQVPNPARQGQMKSVLNPMRARAHEAEYLDETGDDTDLFQHAVAESRWALNPQAKIAGSLQTTLGVAAARLLSNVARTRANVVTLLVGDAKKREKVLDILSAAIRAQQWLTTAGNPLAAYSAQSFRIRMVMFMYLANKAARVLGGVWTKTALGANFKGYSSFVGCGVGANNDLLTSGIAALGLDADTVRTNLLNAMKNNGAHTWLTQALDGHLELDEIGKPGLSIQTDVEGWFAIPNFIVNNRLYTVVESREKASLLNIKMVEFLNGSGRHDANAFYTYVRGIVVA